MPLNDAKRLRSLLGEEVPDGGSVGDTLFTDEKINELLASNGGDIERAAYEGWRVKAAMLSNLVDSTEGNIARKFSQLVDHANDMIKLYSRTSAGNTEGRARVGRLSRPGVEW